MALLPPAEPPVRPGIAAPGALAGIRVLDVATFLAAPVAATLLGEFGAEVVKIEEPGRGDFPRWHASGRGGRTAQWAQEGRNKESVGVDLRVPEGQELVRELAARCDVVVTNFRPATAARWCIAPADLMAGNDQLVVLSVTGFGLTGPYRDRGAFDRIASAFAGHTYVSGYPEHPPVRSGFAMIDYLGAYAGAFAVLAALRARDAGLGGQVIDLALTDIAIRASEASPGEYAATGRLRERVGNRHPTVVPASEAETSDGHRVSYHAGSEALFPRLAVAIGRPELVDDARFTTPALRVEHQDDLYAIVASWMAERPAAAAVERLNACGVPATKVNSAADLLSDPHVAERGVFERFEDPELGDVVVSTPVPRLARTPGRTRELGPALGASTDAVLHRMLGLDRHRRDDLRARGVIS